MSMQLPPVDGRGAASSTSVISAGDLAQFDRMSTIGAPTSAEALKNKRLRQISQSRYKQWGNTMEAMREKKKLEKASREEVMEAEQREIDRQEAAYQEGQRRAAIERANRLLYNQTDRVKDLHSAAMISTVCKEREKQLYINRQRRLHENRREQVWVDIERETLVQMTAKEEEALRLRKEKDLQTRAEQQRQLEFARERRKQLSSAERAEGEERKRLAIEQLAEAKRIELIKLEKQKQLNHEYLDENVKQQALKAERIRLEAMEDARNAEYALEKEKVELMRQKHEEQLKRNKAQRFQAMLARQAELLESLREAEGKRTQKQFKELEDKTRENELKKAEEYRTQLELTVKSREHQIASRNARQQQDKMEEELLAMEWTRKIEEMTKKEIEEELKKIANNIKHQGFLKMQMQHKRERLHAYDQAEIEEAKTRDQAMIEDDLQFERYANSLMDKAKARNQTVVPLKLALRKHKKTTFIPTEVPQRPAFSQASSSGFSSTMDFKKRSKSKGKHGSVTSYLHSAPASGITLDMTLTGTSIADVPVAQY